jgi:hypothetical protein
LALQQRAKESEWSLDLAELSIELAKLDPTKRHSLGQRVVSTLAEGLRTDRVSLLLIDPRCPAITGAFCALFDALQKLRLSGKVTAPPLKDFVAAVSVGVLGRTTLLDLCYEEDHRAEVDMNIVMTGGGHFVELQGTAEQRPFDRALLEELVHNQQGAWMPRVSELLVKCETLGPSLEIIEGYLNKARQMLGTLPESNGRTGLFGLAEYLARQTAVLSDCT